MRLRAIPQSIPSGNGSNHTKKKTLNLKPVPQMLMAFVHDVAVRKARESVTLIIFNLRICFLSCEHCCSYIVIR